MGKIINEKHFTRICNLIDPSKVVCGGDNNPGALQIAPTVMDNVTFGGCSNAGGNLRSCASCAGL